jgi:electron transfer flavoprotein alpha/beta subunit
VTQVADVALVDGEESVGLVRDLDQGFRERVELRLPAVVTVVAGPSILEAPAPPDIPVLALLDTHGLEIPVWDLADLGVPYERVRQADHPLIYGRPRPRHPRLHHPRPLDPTLPAFERIQKLVRGSVKLRNGRVVREPADALSDF